MGKMNCVTHHRTYNYFATQPFLENWADRWTTSSGKEDLGEFKVTAGKYYNDEAADAGLQTSEDAKFYGSLTGFDTFSSEGKSLFVQVIISLTPPGSYPRCSEPSTLVCNSDITTADGKKRRRRRRRRKRKEEEEEAVPNTLSRFSLLAWLRFCAAPGGLLVTLCVRLCLSGGLTPLFSVQQTHHLLMVEIEAPSCLNMFVLSSACSSQRTATAVRCCNVE